MNNSIKCKCKKKTFVRGYIYKLTVGPYYYIGLTDTTIKNRYSAHKTSCFNKRENEKTEIKYNSKIYKTIRKELCRITGKSITEINQKDFEKYVLVEEVADVDSSREDLKILETLLINKNDKLSLNSIN